MRSASPSLWVRSTIASSRYRGTRHSPPPSQLGPYGGCGVSVSGRGSCRGLRRRRVLCQQSRANSAAAVAAAPAGTATRGSRWPARAGRWAAPRPASRRRRTGWIGSIGWPTTKTGAWIRRRWLRRRREPAEEQPVDAPRRCDSARWSTRVEADAGPERHDPAGHRPARAAQGVDGDRQEARGEHHRRERQDPGHQRVVEHRHLHDQALDPLGRDRPPPRGRRWRPATCRR